MKNPFYKKKMNNKLFFILFSSVFTIFTNEKRCKSPLFHKLALAFQDKEKGFEFNFPCCKHCYKAVNKKRIGCINRKDKINKIIKKANKQITLLKNKDEYLNKYFKNLLDELNIANSEYALLKFADQVFLMIKLEIEYFNRILETQKGYQVNKSIFIFSCEDVVGHNEDPALILFELVYFICTSINFYEGHVKDVKDLYETGIKPNANASCEVLDNVIIGWGKTMHEFISIILAKKINEQNETIEPFYKKLIIYFDYFIECEINRFSDWYDKKSEENKIGESTKEPLTKVKRVVDGSIEN